MICKKRVTDLSIDEFCARYEACQSGWDWAIRHCKTMADCWNLLPEAYLLWIATRPHVLVKADQYRFAAYCGKQVKHMIRHPLTNKAIWTAEAHALGHATSHELWMMQRDICQLRKTDKDYAENYAAGCAIHDMLDASGWEAASGAVGNAEIAVKNYYKTSPVRMVMELDTRLAKYLRQNCVPNFKRRAHAKPSGYWGPESLSTDKEACHVG